MGPQQILLALSFTYAIIHCDIVRTDNGGFRASFEIINIGRMYDTLANGMKLNVYACAVACIRRLNCVTINHNDKENLCELVGEKYDEFEADISDPHWANYGTPDKIDGYFTPWTKVDTCTVTCGTGTQIEQRSCDNPQPRFGGKPCKGKTVRQVECNANPCPIHGAWSSWVETGFCSTCSRTRKCDNPKPKYNGLKCLNMDGKTRSVEEIIKPCKPCIITDYVQCNFVPGNINGGDTVKNGELSGEACMEFCYGEKKSNPEIVGVVNWNQHDKKGCWCKSKTGRTGDHKFKSCPLEEVNLALARSPNQSPTYNTQYASLAVDGDKRTWSRSDTTPTSWWTVEMKTPFILRVIWLNLSNKNLAKYTKLKVKTKLYTHEEWKLCKSFDQVLTKNLNPVICNEHKKTTKYVRIENDDILLLHEVDVYGWPASVY